MANKKFSEFTLKTDTANVDFVVGYDGTDNVRIDPANISGATNLNGLTDCLVDTDSLYVGEVPSGLSGNPQDNTILGIDSGTALTSGNSNTLIGNNTGAGISTGSGYTIVGKDAGNGATYTGSNVIMLGYNVEASSATVSNEITLGDSNITSFRIPGIQSGASDGDVLTFNSSAGKLELQAAGGGGASDLNGLSDCLVDTDSLYVGEVPSGLSGNPQGNTVLGIDAGNALTSAANNTLLGNDAGKILTTAASNVIIGKSAGAAKTSGNNATIIGTAAGRDTASGNMVVLIGSEAGISNTGDNAIAIGSEAGRVNTAAATISIGHNAGYSQTSGTNNTNLGYKAGYANTTGVSNVVMGYEAGRNNTGGYNTLIGVDAARAKTSGSDNVAIGFRALYTETSGQRNTAIGYQALQAQDQEFAAHNTAVGWQADDSNTTGYYRTNIGASTGGTSTGANITNIGFGAQESSSTVSNEVTLGNSSVATLRCAVTSITSLSDERDKTDIKDLGYGLAFIDALQPREFVWDNRAETNKDGEEFYSSNKGKKDFGFIAQEVKELDNDTLRLVYDENPDKLELSYGKLVPVLVQAIKELKAEIELLKS